VTNPHCPKCKGIGWYESPYYGDFGPKVIKLACEDCLPHSKPTKAEIVMLAAIFILFAFLIVGVP
jgi:hypothetical protein